MQLFQGFGNMILDPFSGYSQRFRNRFMRFVFITAHNEYDSGLFW
jgi:hypothetical protein